MNETETKQENGATARIGSSDLFGSWVPGDKPDIPKGSAKRFWVTVRSKERGTLWVIPMSYMHAHVMTLSDQCEDPPDCAAPHNPDPVGYCEDY